MEIFKVTKLNNSAQLVEADYYTHEQEFVSFYGNGSPKKQIFTIATAIVATIEQQDAKA